MQPSQVHSMLIKHCVSVVTKVCAKIGCAKIESGLRAFMMSFNSWSLKIFIIYEQIS